MYKFFFILALLCSLISCSKFNSESSTVKLGEELTFTYKVNGSTRIGVELNDSVFNHVKFIKIIEGDNNDSDELCFGCDYELTWIFKAVSKGKDSIKFSRYFYDDTGKIIDTTFVNYVEID